MQDQYPIEVALSKSKLFGLLLLSGGFVAIGLWLIAAQEIWFLGLLSLAFFGVAGIFMLLKLFDLKPGLILNEQGLIDNAGGLSSGQMLYWTEIEDIWVTQVSSQQFITLGLKEPLAYIEKEPNSWKRRLMKMNHRLYGSPVQISTSSLKIDFHRLYPLIVDTWQAHQNEQQLFVPTSIQEYKNRH
jgi:hypothetical protein